MSQSNITRFRVACFLPLLVLVGCGESNPEKPKAANASPEVERVVRAVVARQLKVKADGIDMKKPLSALNADDLDIVEMVMDLEEQLDITIPDSAIERYGVRMTA